MEKIKIICCITLFFCFAAGLTWASVYFNSAESGCDGSDPNVLMCDDFEDGVWYRTDCDTSGGEEFGPNNGWCGSIYANPITPPNAAVCGNSGAGGTNCAATSGVRNGIEGGRNMASHQFTGGQKVDELYARWYQKPLTGFLPGHEKIMFFQDEFDHFQCCLLMFPFGNNVPDLQTQNSATARLPQNQGNELAFTPGHWYYIEVHLKLNSPGQSNGVFELWMDDCGTLGLGCNGPGTLRASYTNRDDLRDSVSSHQIRQIWLENWANPGSTGTEYYDQIKVSKFRVGPIAMGPYRDFNFSLSNDGSKAVIQGQTTSNTITATLSSGTAQSVSFSASGFPSGATYSFSPPLCNPTCTTTLSINTINSIPLGNYTINVNGIGGGLTRTTNFRLTINPIIVNSCSWDFFPGDIPDGKVTLGDVIAVVNNFGTSLLSPGFNAKMDFNNNNQIDLFDVLTVLAHFGGCQ